MKPTLSLSWRMALPILLLGIGLRGGLGNATHGAALSPRTPDCFTRIASPSPGSGSNILSGLAPITANDVWAVGSSTDAGSLDRGLLEHWDGATWQVVSGANPGTGGHLLRSVTALSAGDVWAVGVAYDPGATPVSLVEHWDGTAWQVIPSPSPGATANTLWGVAAAGAADAWAVGSYANPGGPPQTLILHWNGSAWTPVPSPSPGTGSNQLNAVVALAPNNAWAVGAFTNQSAPQPLLLHWNGTAWASVPVPSAGSSSSLLAIAGSAAADLWATGNYTDGSGTAQPLTLHWDGALWSRVAAPNPGTGSAVLRGVFGHALDDAWAVGYDTSGPGVAQPLVEHWDGSRWRPVAAPGSQYGGQLTAVAALDADDVWTVGVDSSSPQATLVLHACPNVGATQTAVAATATVQTATAVVSQTAAARTATAGASQTAAATRTAAAQTATVAAQTATAAAPTATGTPTPSATPCPLQFADVPPGAYFYQPVEYLACRGVVSGYGDGSFRPYNTTTRAQLIKIVVVGEGIPVYVPPPDTHTFADVLRDHPFFAYVESAAHVNVVGGYNCGGPGEPCDDQHRPYFRPYAAVTRGQLAKLMVLSARWPLLNPPPPGHFADVLPTSTYYVFAETASCHGLISGYTCGGPGEPCNPGNQPYFRPYDNATRGQIAKIAYGALTGTQICAASKP